MKTLARMEFKSGARPAERGALVITDDGFLQVQPSAEFIDELARLESEALETSRKIGGVVSWLLIGSGLLVAAIAWMAGRIGGELRETLTKPHPLEDVAMAKDEYGGVHVEVPGSGPQKISIHWEAGETDAEESAKFISTYRKYLDASRQ